MFVTIEESNLILINLTQNFRNYVIVAFAQVSGIVVTLIVKIMVLFILRRSFFAAFYRRRPGAANIMATILECWNVGLSTLYMIIRSIILIIITAVFVARIDTPLLAPGVGNIGPIILDAGPFAFRKDLLLHDAHRHPYIERLGLLYMLKVRYGDSFAMRSGSCWRLLFTVALMPWFRKFRIRSYVESLGDHTNENERLAETTKMMRTVNSKDEDASARKLLEKEVNILRERVRELEEEIYGMNQASFQNEPLQPELEG
jgi:hypothetical protein